ncbi:MAG: YbfB/YjiJ family MFS transporter [Hydrogenophaga sp.]
MADTSAPYLRLALALSLGAAVSLGITRFAYGLLLPPMREDLMWSYTLAGGMNTANAVGYLIGALATPALLRRWSASTLLLWGAVGASVFMALSGFFVGVWPLMAQRLLAGVASAVVFIAGGLLAARLGARQAHRSGLLLGLYYGGTGIGIVLSALLVPVVLQSAQAQPHAWAWAWWCLALVCVLATLVLVWPARVLGHWDAVNAAQAAPSTVVQTFEPRRMGFALAGYTGFGVGYIGYMTFVIALLREQGATTSVITVFYAALGAAVVLGSRIWAGLLDRHRDGQSIGRLNALLGAATVLPALTAHPLLLLLSGVVFGAVFLSVVASTTAFVRHNLPPALWGVGISAFTIVFAAGQIVGPTVVGFIADGPGGLERGLVFSAVALWVGSALAFRQRALTP